MEDIHPIISLKNTVINGLCKKERDNVTSG